MDPAKKIVHEEVALLKKDNGVVCSVTKYTKDRRDRYSFAFQKVYDDKQGDEKRSHWFDRRHLSAIRELIDEVENWLEDAEDRARAQHRVGR
jgi:predicted dinucleotide-utilizing enzyme